MHHSTMEPLVFASAYRQLTTAQKAFVDGFVTRAETESEQSNQPLASVLSRPIPDHIVTASRGMLHNPIVAAAITERINEISLARELSLPRVMRELRNIALSSVGEVLEFDELTGDPYINLQRANPDQLSAIKSIEFDEQTGGMSRATRKKTKVVWHDKLKAIELYIDLIKARDPDNPYLRADAARPVSSTPITLKVGTAPAVAADMYSRMING